MIIGQDPYHGVNQAHGLAFSVRPPTRAPPSLINIYTALKNDYPNFHPPPQRGGLLTPWADRGVLMLNTCLTVEAAKANSHANHGWEKFTQKVIDIVAKTRTRGVVFLAWGNPAGQRVSKVNRSVHCVLQSVHPSPLSAARGFVSCFFLSLFFLFWSIFFSPTHLFFGFILPPPPHDPSFPLNKKKHPFAKNQKLTHPLSLPTKSSHAATSRKQTNGSKSTTAKAGKSIGIWTSSLLKRVYNLLLVLLRPHCRWGWRQHSIE